MTAKRDLKSIIRDRQRKTGESYTAARAHVMRDRAERLGIEEQPSPPPVEAAVFQVWTNTARIRIAGEAADVTLRSRDTSALVPGLVITLRIEKRTTVRGIATVSGKVEDLRIDTGKLGLAPLPLDGGDLENLRDTYENVRAPDPYAPIWRKNTAKPRRCYEMNEIAWGAFPDADPDDNPTIEATELREAGDIEGAHDLLIATLGHDLRCLDAHAHLGNLVFDDSPERALMHYEIGMRIGDLSLGTNFDGVLAWSGLYNRPYLRCIHGYGLSLWRLGRTDDAARVFERMLALNPNDNQGARFCLFDVRDGMTWEAAQARDDAEDARIAEAARSIRAAQTRRKQGRDNQRFN